MIDFPDEGDTRHVQLEDVYRRIDTVLDQVHKLGATFKNGKVASRGLKVAIAGAPNAGKSTLLNSLLGRSRAIVSEQAGTTRDYLEEPCILDGRLIVLIDTAGIRNTDDVIERDGIAMSRQVLADADVVLALYALDSTPTDRNLIESILSSLKKPVIPIVSKSDLNTPPDWSRDLLCISCKTEAGLGQLRNKLTQLVDQATETIEERPFITSARQAAAISAAEDALIKFKTSAAKAAGHEMLAFELQEAARALKSIVGDISSDDVLDVIFREFCIGK